MFTDSFEENIPEETSKKDNQNYIYIIFMH